MQPQRRDLHFKLPADRILDWHGDGPAITAFVNALSVMYPEGERFFIQSVRHFRDAIDDPALKSAVTAFIGQEAMHGREHDNWNEALFAKVPQARVIERKAARRIKRWQRWLPKSTQLSMTIGAEHVTAILGDLMLRNPQLLNGENPQQASQPDFVTLLRWHGLEETEHKAVAFDVWRHAMRGKLRAYPERCLGLILMLAAYWNDINALIRVSLAEQDIDYEKELPKLKRYLRGSQGLFSRLRGPLLEYFKPGFHPWDEDNRELLNELAGAEIAKHAA